MCARRSSALFVTPPHFCITLSHSFFRLSLSSHYRAIGRFQGQGWKKYTSFGTIGTHFPKRSPEWRAFFRLSFKNYGGLQVFFVLNIFILEKHCVHLICLKKIFNFQLNFKNREVRQVKSFLVFLKNK